MGDDLNKELARIEQQLRDSDPSFVQRFNEAGVPERSTRRARRQAKRERGEGHPSVGFKPGEPAFPHRVGAEQHQGFRSYGDAGSRWSLFSFWARLEAWAALRFEQRRDGDR